MISRSLKIRGLILSATMITVVAGCSKDAAGPTSTPPPVISVAADVDTYMQVLPSWKSFSQWVDAVVVAKPESTVADMSSLVMCKTVPYDIRSNPEEVITMGSAPGVLYLGSLIQGNSYLGGIGTMQELPIRQRAPLSISLDVVSGSDVDSVVSDPSASSINGAIGNMVARAAAAGAVSGVNTTYKRSESYSAQQAALSLNLSYRSLVSDVKGKLNVQRTGEKRTVTAFFKQVMYTAYIDLPQSPSTFFSSDFTQTVLDQQVQLGNIGPNNLPVYVASIQYGRMLLFSMTYEASEETLKAAVDASYGGFDGSTSAEVKNILSSAEFTVTEIGGSGQNVINLIRTGQLSDYFGTTDPLTTAKPLAYTLRYLGDNSLALVSEVTSYNVTECSPADAQVYTNKSEWLAAMAELSGGSHSYRELPTTATNLTLANEINAVPGPNASLGHTMTFDSAVTGYPFTFYLQAAEGPQTLMIWDDRVDPGFVSAWGNTDHERSISLGNVTSPCPCEENDNFAYGISAWNTNHAAVFALGISVGGNSAESGEGVYIYGIGGFNQHYYVTINSEGLEGFLGIVSTVPLTQIWFDEAPGDDDIWVRDFSFGFLEW